jgi:hypothetical protein
MSFPFISFVTISGPADHQFEALAAHHFDEDGELEFTATEDFEAVRTPGFFHANGDVGEQFLFEALAEIARGDPLALAAHHGRVVDGELHGDGGLVDDDGGQGRGVFDAGDGFADGDAFNAGDGDNIVDLGSYDVHTMEAAEAEHFGDAGFL